MLHIIRHNTWETDFLVTFTRGVWQPSDIGFLRNHICLCWLFCASLRLNFKYFFLSLLPSSTEKMVGTATPKEPLEQWKAAWKFSTGDELMIGWESCTSTSGLSFCLKNQMSPEPSVGRKFMFFLQSWLS